MRERIRRAVAVGRPGVVGPVTVGHGVNEFLSIVIPPVIPLLVTDFDITYGEAGLLLTVFFLMYLLFQLPAGILGDRIGGARLIVVGLLAMVVGVGLASTANSYGTLLAAQAVAGIGGSTFHPAGMSVISDVEGATTEGRAMGVFGLGGTLGTMASPVVVGGVAAVAGWRLALGVAAGLGLIVTGLAGPALLRARGDRDDAATTDGGRSPTVAGRIRSIIANAGLVGGWPVVVLFAVTMMLSMQTRGILTFTTAYVSTETGLSVLAGNLSFFGLLVGGSIVSVPAGGLADRRNRPRLGMILGAGTAIIVAATAVAIPVFSGLTRPVLVAILAVWFATIGGVVYALFPLKNALVSRRAETASSGGLFGLIQTASAIGSAAGPAVFGILATRWGVGAAFPAISLTGVVLVALFAILSRLE
ncbi:MAG: MFS transporter [Salinirussus sp.]